MTSSFEFSQQYSPLVTPIIKLQGVLFIDLGKSGIHTTTYILNHHYKIMMKETLIEKLKHENFSRLKMVRNVVMTALPVAGLAAVDYFNTNEKLEFTAAHYAITGAAMYTLLGVVKPVVMHIVDKYSSKPHTMDMDP